MDLTIAFDNFSRHIKLTDDEKLAFESIVSITKYPRRTQVLKLGEVCKYEFFVLKGCLRSYYFDANTIDHTTMFAPEGWWTGNLKSFVREEPSQFYLETLEKCTLLKLDKSSMEELYRRVPKFERYFRILLQNRLLATQDRINNHLSASAKERYEKFTQVYPDLMQRLPLKHIASYLGITPTYLSRLRAMKN